MNGIHFVTNESGLNTAIQIDLNVLRKKRIDGRKVADYLALLEDIIDVELSKSDESDDWETFKQHLKKDGKLSTNVSHQD